MIENPIRKSGISELRRQDTCMDLSSETRWDSDRGRQEDGAVGERGHGERWVGPGAPRRSICHFLIQQTWSAEPVLFPYPTTNTLTSLLLPCSVSLYFPMPQLFFHYLLHLQDLTRFLDLLSWNAEQFRTQIYDWFSMTILL